MKVHRIGFEGALLERGFWLYAWMIKFKVDKLVYVGRTGDSSSQFAASPFSRLSQHLDVRPRASANMLLRHVSKKGWDPTACSYELVAFGPIFPEQSDLMKHRSVRDIIAPLETELAILFKAEGYEVPGSHGKPRPADPLLLQQVRDAFHRVFD